MARMGLRSSREARRHLFSVAESQGGYFTAKQAKSLGYGPSHVAYHVEQGNFARIEQGLFRLVEVPLGEHDQLIRLSLWSRNRNDQPQGVVSHETALVLHDLGEVLPEQVHLIVPPGFRKRAPGGCVLHTGRIAPEEIEERAGFRVTNPVRTLLDVAKSTLPLEQLEKAVTDALRLGLVSRQELSLAARKGSRLHELSLITKRDQAADE